MKENKEIKSIADTLEQVSGDEKFRRIAELTKGYAWWKSSLDYVTEKGIAKGHAQLISNMFKNGATIESLEKLTGLDRKELEEILASSKYWKSCKWISNMLKYISSKKF